MLKFMFYICCIFVFVSPARSAGFDDLYNQVASQKEQTWDVYMGEINRRDQEFERLWLTRKAEIEQKWDKALRSTQTKWVEYSPDLDSFSQVDFKNSQVELMAVVPANTDKPLQQAQQLIAKRLKSLLEEKDNTGQEILHDQVPLPKVLPQSKTKPTPPEYKKQVQQFVEQQKNSITLQAKPVIGKDGQKRIKASLKFKLLPNNLQKRIERYRPLVLKYGQEFAVSPALILAVIHTESCFNPKAASPANAHGLMQLIPKYGARDAYRYVFGKDKVVSPDFLYQPENNIRLGTAYLSILKSRTFKKINPTDKQDYLSICSYNWGPGAVMRKVVKPNNMDVMSSEAVYKLLRQVALKETSDYLQRVTKRRKMYAKAGYGQQ